MRLLAKFRGRTLEEARSVPGNCLAKFGEGHGDWRLIDQQLGPGLRPWLYRGCRPRTTPAKYRRVAESRAAGGAQDRPAPPTPAEALPRQSRGLL